MAIQPFNPGSITLGGGQRQSNPVGPITSGPIQQGGGNRPYLPTNPITNPVNPIRKPVANPMQPPQQPQTSQTLGAQGIRATGSGPYDSAYRQNLATYAGGLFNRPNGLLSFNPTDPNALQGNPTGGGNAPVQGSPTGLLDQALGGQPFSWTQPPPTQPTQQNPWQFWLKQFNQPGSFLRQSRNSY